MSREKTIDRIKKLIALSKNNPNKNEGLSAHNKAQELLKKYGLTMADIEPRSEIPPIYGQKPYMAPKSNPEPVYTPRTAPEPVYTAPFDREPEKIKTPFFETTFGIFTLLALKGLFGTPFGWIILYVVFFK